LDGFIPSSSEKAAIFLLVEVVPGLQWSNMCPDLSIGSYIRSFNSRTRCIRRTICNTLNILLYCLCSVYLMIYNLLAGSSWSVSTASLLFSNFIRTNNLSCTVQSGTISQRHMIFLVSWTQSVSPLVVTLTYSIYRCNR
jgi:hypothetical protein